MSEGLNLQQASVVVLLDMPSVMRLAEQRIGRVDRMNSPHQSIEVYFPDDHVEFALKTDKSFFSTAQTVNSLIGGNIFLPDDLLEKWKLKKWEVETISGKSAIKLYEAEKDKSETTFQDGIQDAFQPVKDLVFGENSLIEQKVYESIKFSKSTLVSKVDISKVISSKNFGFFCIRGSNFYAPYWLYVDEDTNKENKKVYNNLHEICKKLRQNLINCIDLKPGEELDNGQKIMDGFLQTIKENEIESLPNKKRRSLLSLKDIIEDLLKDKKIDLEKKKILDELANIYNPISEDDYSVDYYQFAKKWISMIQPILNDLRKDKTQKKILHLRSEILIKELKNKLSTDDFKILKDGMMFIKKIDKRIASCIIGVRSEKSVN